MISQSRCSLFAFTVCLAPLALANPASADKPSAGVVPYRASSVPGVRVRSVPMKRAGAGSASVYRRPGAIFPRGLPKARKRNPASIRPLPGGGVVAKVDKSWQAESRAVIVNGRVYTMCTNPAHNAKAHYHDAKGTARTVR